MILKVLRCNQSESITAWPESITASNSAALIYKPFAHLLRSGSITPVTPLSTGFSTGAYLFSAGLDEGEERGIKGFDLITL